MSTRFRTSVDYVSVIQGAVQDEAAALGIFEHGAAIPQRHRRGNLYILVETIGAFTNPAQIQQQVVRVAQDRFEHTSGSITAGIREAIKAANEYVYEHNVNAEREERGVAGITCMVLRGQDAYVGQCGPALLYHVSEDETQRLPTDSSWLVATELQDVDVEQHPPLGMRHDIEPVLYHRYLQGRDVFILSSSALARIASDDEVARLALRRAAAGVRRNLEELLEEGQDLSAIVVQIEEAAAEAEAEAADAPVEPVPADKGPSLVERMRSFFPTVQDAPEAEDDFEPEPEERFPWLQAVGRVASSIGLALNKAAQGTREMVVRMLPDSEPRRRARAGRPPQAGGLAHKPLDRRWMWLALIIPVLIVALVLTTKMQQQKARQAQLDNLVKQAQDARAHAAQSSNVAEQRDLLANAMTVLIEAEKLKADDPRIPAERQMAAEALDHVNRVTRIALAPLGDLPPGQEGTGQAATIVVREGNLYVLDQAADQVYRYLLNESRDGVQQSPENKVILAKGDQYAGVTVGELMDMVWAEAGGERTAAGLVILDKLGQELAYDPADGVTLLPMMDNSGWKEPVAATTFYENLYLLDPQGGTVLKYLPSARGYDMPAGAYFTDSTPPPIQGAVDFAIDGHVYILFADGSVSQYLTGKKAEFALDKADVEAKNPTAIVATGPMKTEGELQGSLYVLDSGNQRILRYSKDGQFVQQLRCSDPALLAQPRGLFVDEDAKKLYVVDGTKVYVAALP